jgi:hypothetical protein
VVTAQPQIYLTNGYLKTVLEFLDNLLDGVCSLMQINDHSAFDAPTRQASTAKYFKDSGFCRLTPDNTTHLIAADVYAGYTIIF